MSPEFTRTLQSRAHSQAPEMAPVCTREGRAAQQGGFMVSRGEKRNWKPMSGCPCATAEPAKATPLSLLCCAVRSGRSPPMGSCCSGNADLPPAHTPANTCPWILAEVREKGDYAKTMTYVCAAGRGEDVCVELCDLYEKIFFSLRSN